MSSQQSQPFSSALLPTFLPEFEPTVAPVLESTPLAVPGQQRSRAWLRLAGTPAAITLWFDAAVFAAMGILGWKLFMPWSDALSAGESLMAIGLLVCAGLWASICAEDLHRWRKMCRRWSVAARRHPQPVAEVASHSSDALAPPSPRVRSLVRPTRLTARARRHSPWHVVSRVDFSGPGGPN